MAIFNGKNIMLVGLKGDKGEKGDTGAKLVSRVLQGQDENGGNIYLDTFDDGTTATLTAPKGDKGEDDKAQIDKNTTDIKLLYAGLKQKNIIIPATLENSEAVRPTGGEMTVVDGSTVTVKKIEGNTVAVDGVFKHAQISGIKGTGRNLYPYSGGMSFDKAIPIKANTTYYVKVFTASSTLTAGRNTLVFFRADGTQIMTENELGIKSTLSGYFQAATGRYMSGSDHTQTEYSFSVITDCYVAVSSSINSGETKNYAVSLVDYLTDYEPYTESVMNLPETVELPLGKTIDFENGKIVDYGNEVILKGTEDWVLDGSPTHGDGVRIYNYLPATAKAKGGANNTVCTDAPSSPPSATIGAHHLVCNNERMVYWTGILAYLGIDRSVTGSAEASITAFNAWLAQKYADGNPVIVRYVSTALQSESEIDIDNTYIVHANGSEQMQLENSESVPTITAEYLILGGAE